jgi:hypothetical protein
VAVGNGFRLDGDSDVDVDVDGEVEVEAPALLVSPDVVPPDRPVVVVPAVVVGPAEVVVVGAVVVALGVARGAVVGTGCCTPVPPPVVAVPTVAGLTFR